MSIFNEYLTGYDRELAIEESAFDVEFSRLQTMYEMTNLQLTQMQKDAELKVLTESGTYDDLTYLITEAEAEVAEQKKGILARIIDLISKIFSAIGSKLNSLVNKGNENAIVEAPADAVEKGNALVNAINDIKTGCAQIKSGDWSGALKILNGAKAPAIAAAGCFAANVGIKKYKKGELDNLIAKIKQAFDAVQSFFNGIKDKFLGLFKSENADNENQGFSIIKEIGSHINTFVAKLKKCIDDSISKLTGKDNNAQDQAPEGNNAQNQAPTVRLSTNHNGAPYRLWTDGRWEKRGKDKKWIEIPTPPKALVDIANSQLKQESSIEEIQAIVGADVIVEKTEDGFNLIDNSSEMMESTASSIFGYNLENEEVLQESADAFDQELEELSELFKGL